MRTRLIVGMVCLVMAHEAMAQVSSPQQLFESGQNEQAAQGLAARREGGTAGPSEAFLEGLVLTKLDQADGARQAFSRLAASEDPAWVAVGESALALVASDLSAARDAATRAVAAAPGLFEAQYQLGVVRARFEEWAGCAEAFSRAAELNPSFAYAHYYAGLSYSRSGRADRTSEHFERFLKLAPRAPERAAVESLMRTLRGR